MLILLSVTAHVPRSAPEAYPPTDEMATTVFEKMLNLLRRTRFYRLQGLNPGMYMLQRNEDAAVSGGVSNPPTPQTGCCVSHQSGCCWVYHRQKQQSTRTKEKVGYPYQHTTHTYLKHGASAGLQMKVSQAPIVCLLLALRGISEHCPSKKPVSIRPKRVLIHLVMFSCFRSC